MWRPPAGTTRSGLITGQAAHVSRSAVVISRLNERFYLCTISLQLHFKPIFPITYSRHLHTTCGDVNFADGILKQSRSFKFTRSIQGCGSRGAGDANAHDSQRPSGWLLKTSSVAWRTSYGLKTSTLITRPFL